MRDDVIVRMVQETCKVLSEMHPYEECRSLVPSYNALLDAARANHPEESFLKVLPSLPDREDSHVSSGNFQILFAQLRIMLEGLATEGPNELGQTTRLQMGSEREGLNRERRDAV